MKRDILYRLPFFYKNLEIFVQSKILGKNKLNPIIGKLNKSILLWYFRFFLKNFVFRQNRIQDNVNLLSMVLKEILSTSMESALYHKVSFEKRPDLLPNILFIFLRPIYTSIFNCSVYSCYHYFIILYSKGISCINMTLYELCFPYFKLFYFVH